MSSLKRNMIELVKNPEAVNKGEEPEIEKVWTPPFLPLGVARDAMQLFIDLDEDLEMSESDKFDKMVDFVANEIYRGKITKDDLYNRLHAPDGKVTLQDQIYFAAEGKQSEITKNFLAKKG